MNPFLCIILWIIIHKKSYVSTILQSIKCNSFMSKFQSPGMSLTFQWDCSFEVVL